jgi:hypothetical protein
MRAKSYYVPISEQSQKSYSTDFKFSDQKYNSSVYNELMKDDHKERIFKDWIPESTQFYKLRNKYYQVKDSKVIFFCQWELKYYSIFNRNCIEFEKIWRNTGQLESEKVPTNVFFELLFPTTHIIMMDAEKTEDGLRFWDNMVGKAFRKGLNIYYIKLLAPNKQLVKINIPSDYSKYWDIAHGIENKYQAQRFIITDIELEESKVI